MDSTDKGTREGRRGGRLTREDCHKFKADLDYTVRHGLKTKTNKKTGTVAQFRPAVTVLTGVSVVWQRSTDFTQVVI